MDMVRRVVEHLNAAQTPVLTFNQPLFALAKDIQWQWPEKYGVEKFVVMFGGLHIEMAALKAIGDWLEGSGWAEALVQAQIVTVGMADLLQKTSHVMRIQLLPYILCPVDSSTSSTLQDTPGYLQGTGHFMVQKTKRVFSVMPIDQAHEQNNAHVKGDGGAVDLTDNPRALRHWMITGPEIARVIGQFEVHKVDTRHHDQTPADVNSLVSVIEELGNPFK